MDFFGIGVAVKSVVSVYFLSARRTGRTVSMLESIKDGDRIIFANSKEADRIKKLFHEYDLTDIECIVADPKTPERLLEHGTNQGRTIFDHSWVEEYYLHSIKRCEAGIDYFQREMSGYGEPHRETKRKAIELARWQF